MSQSSDSNSRGQSKKKKILFLSPYPYGKAASQRLKFEQYFDHFRGNGYELTTSSFVDDAFWKVIYQKGHLVAKMMGTLRGYMRRFADLFRLRNYDAVYVHLWVTPLGPPLFEWLVGKISRRMIFDIDDMTFMTGKSAANPLKTWLNGKKKGLSLMKLADHVITCTPELNDYAKKHCAYATDISSTLDTDRMVPMYRYNNDQPVTIGWTGTHSTVPYLYLLQPVFQQLAKERKFRLYVIGNFDFHMDGVNYEYVNWSKDDEVKQLQQLDIGVYPLPTDAWVLGKSGLKALQYMTFALPTVATNIGNAINRIIIDGQNGYLVTTPEEWLERLRYLIDHPEERERVGQAARKTVMDSFSVQANRKIYLDILNSVTEKSNL